MAPVSVERSVLEKRLSAKGTTEPCLLAISTTLNLFLCLNLPFFGKEVCAITVDNPRQTGPRFQEESLAEKRVWGVFYIKLVDGDFKVMTTHVFATISWRARLACSFA